MNTSGHYYTQTGEPSHFVPRASGSGTRPATVKDARERGLIPSVTTILKILDKPALQNWLIRQAVMAVVTAPEIKGEALDDRLTRILDTERQQDAEAAAARDKGTEIHAALEAYLQGRATEIAPSLKPWIAPAMDWIAKVGAMEKTEFILVGRGYAGKADLLLRTDSGRVLVDFKSAKTLPKKDSWPEHRLQLAAYAKVLEDTLPADGPITVANLYISTTECGQILWAENRNWQADWCCFEHLLHVWRHLNGFPPL